MLYHSNNSSSRTDTCNIKQFKHNTMIKEFQNEYRWLSNFAPVKIILDGITYPSVEHAYMSAKSDDKDWKEYCSNPINTAGDVKRRSRSIKLKDNWNDIKLDVMRECLNKKFIQEPYRTKLIETGNTYLQEGNRWNDKFWGVCLRTNQGDNRLGKMIMEIREFVR